MSWILTLLREQPFLALLLFGWILSAAGSALKKAGKRAEAARKTQTPPSPSQSSQSAPLPHLPPPTQRRRPSSEEVAAEMRRILGMDSGPPPRTKATPPPVRRTVVTAPAEPVPKPAPPSRIGELRATMERLAGDIEKRKAPLSGNVGAAQLGSLGGRESERQQPRRQAAGLINLNDLPRLIVMTEVLGKPLALRDDW